MTVTLGALIELFHRTLVHLYFGTRWRVGRCGAERETLS